MLKLNRTQWRLISTVPAPGAWNMAVDEAILEFTGRGEVEPTLRLYAWDPPCLSIGYAQSIVDVYFAALQFNHWQVVRRPTGGRAILHTDELTYSVIGPPSDPRLAGSVLESYRRLSRALLSALQAIGVEAQALVKDNPAPVSNLSNPVCFEVPSDYEITYQDKKLIGSAQARRKDAILQHGSLPLHGDLRRIVQVLNFTDQDARNKAASRLHERAITVESALGHQISWDVVATAFSNSFRHELNLDLSLQDLSESEKTRAEELVIEKYANPEWTNRV